MCESLNFHRAVPISPQHKPSPFGCVSLAAIRCLSGVVDARIYGAETNDGGRLWFSLKGSTPMKITGRRLVITTAIRQHIESRFDRLMRYEVKLSHLEVTLSVSKLQHSAEVV